MSVFPDGISSGIGKQSTVGGPPLISEGLNRTKRGIRGNSSCPTAELGHQLFPPPTDLNLNHQLLPGLEPAGFWMGTYTWFSALQTPMGMTPSALLGVQLASCRPWDLSVS